MLRHVAGWIACGSFVLVGCQSSAECVAEYGGDDMDSQSIERLADDGLDACFGEPGSGALESEGDGLPVDVGTDARNGLTLEVFYFCSDVCPDAGWIGLRYRDVVEEACCGVGGVRGYDWAWGSYIGCAPPEAIFGDAPPCGGS